MTVKASTRKKLALRKTALNKTSVGALKPENKPYVIWDRAIPSYGCRVQPTGRRTFILRYRPHTSSKQREITLGMFGAITPDQARKAAMETIAAIHAGQDPLERREAQLLEAERAVALSDALDRYASDHLAHLKHGAEQQRTLQINLKRLLETRLPGLRSSDFADIVSHKRKTAPVMANRLRAYLLTFSNWLIEQGLIEAPLITSGGKRRYREKPRERSLTAAEVAKVWAASDQMPYPWGPFAKLLILTAQRRGEVAEMCWPEINLGRRVWEIPGSRTKNAKPHTVHLSEVAVAILKELEERRKNSSDLVFTTRKDHPVSGFSKAKRELDELSGVEDWRLHDLRRTFVSRCVDFGLDATVVDRVLNHVASSTMSTVARVYQQSEMIEQRRHALEAWSDWVIKSTRGEQPREEEPIAPNAM